MSPAPGSLARELAANLPAPLDDPVVLAGTVGVLLLLAVLAGFLLRRFRRTPGQRFARLLGSYEEVAVLTHPNPDPDAMAAAMGVTHLAEQFGTAATIQYPGQIRHQENRAFRTVLDLDADAITDAEDLAADAVILVDHNEPRGFQGCEAVSPVAVVDHHPESGTGRAFTDIRPEYGACASVIAEYFDELGLDPLMETDGNGISDAVMPQRIATALMYGVLTDTSNLTRGCSPAEFDASEYLYAGIDADRLDRVANPPVDADVLDTISRAIRERDVRGPFAVSDVETVGNVDAISQAADELLRLEGLTAVVVFGDDEETIHLSGRSRDDRIHMGDLLESLVDDIPMSGAGGHARMGGGQISKAHLEGLGPRGGMSREDFIERLFDGMEGDV